MITVYSTPNCAMCNTLKQLYKQNEIDFEEQTIGVDITKEQLEELTGQALRQAPVVFDDGLFIGGFNEANRMIIALKQQKHNEEIAKTHAALADELKVLGIDLL